MSKYIEMGNQSDSGIIQCECDRCVEKRAVPFSDNDIDYKACYDTIKSHGWITKCIDGQWYDFCCNECLQRFVEDKEDGLH